jgi:hypothetical protein
MRTKALVTSVPSNSLLLLDSLAPSLLFYHAIEELQQQYRMVLQETSCHPFMGAAGDRWDLFCRPVLSEHVASIAFTEPWISSDNPSLKATQTAGMHSLCIKVCNLYLVMRGLRCPDKSSNPREAISQEVLPPDGISINYINKFITKVVWACIQSWILIQDRCLKCNIDRIRTMLLCLLIIKVLNASFTVGCPDQSDHWVQCLVDGNLSMAVYSRAIYGSYQGPYTSWQGHASACRVHGDFRSSSLCSFPFGRASKVFATNQHLPAQLHLEAMHAWKTRTLANTNMGANIALTFWLWH